MAWCPFAVHKPLSENHTQGSITPRAVILHTAVSSSNSLFGFFQNNSDLESHFYVTEEGVIEQYMDTGRRADANKNANAFAVSIETEDGARIRPWTAPQLAALIRLVTWICDTHRIPKRQIADAYGSGIGWHVQFGAPGPWTPVSKSCPGAPRIDQTKNQLIPAVANGTKPLPEEDDMPSAQEIADAVWNKAVQNHLDGGWSSASDLLRYGHFEAGSAHRGHAALLAAIAAATKDPALTEDKMREIVREAVQQSIEITGEIKIGPKE